MKNEELFKRIVKLMPMAWNQNSIYPGLIFDIGVPARGQCEPTVCVIQDYFGGDGIGRSSDEPGGYCLFSLHRLPQHAPGSGRVQR